MRVVSVGGTALLVRGLRAALELRGHSCDAVGCGSAHPLVIESTPLGEVPFSGDADAVILHDLDAVLRLGDSPLASRDGILRGLTAIRKQTKRVVLYVSSPVSRLSDPRLKDLALPALLNEAFEFCIFSTYSDLTAVLPPRKIKWLPYPVHLVSNEREIESREVVSEPAFLHIPFQTMPAETSAIQVAFRELKRLDPKVSARIVGPDTLSSEAALLQHLRESHLLLERLYSDTFGLLAVYAMLHGVPVACNVTQRASDAWRLIEAAPVYRIDELSIMPQLVALLEEPRSLRDLSRRAATYMQGTFALDRVSLLLEQLLQG